MGAGLLPPQPADVIASLQSQINTLSNSGTSDSAPVDLYRRIQEAYTFADAVTLTVSAASPYALCDAGFKVGFCLCK